MSLICFLPGAAENGAACVLHIDVSGNEFHWLQCYTVLGCLYRKLLIRDLWVNK